jgi:hypothetical protein
VRVELLDGTHQADVAFLDQVVETHRAASLLAGDGDHERQVVPDELLLRSDLALAGLEGERVLLVAGERRIVANRLEVRGEFLELPASALDAGGLHPLWPLHCPCKLPGIPECRTVTLRHITNLDCFSQSPSPSIRHD